jgi:cyclic beta-1,2-glucan synthetase
VKPPNLPPRITQKLARLASWYQGFVRQEDRPRPEEEQPLRSELYSAQQLEVHARAVAGLHHRAARPKPVTLIPRLLENERVLLETYDLLAKAVENDYQITPAAEWLLDNFYVIEEQILTAHRHLPRSYSQALPQLAGGQAAGMPRVYAIAKEFISHVDGGVDLVGLNAFIASYQTIAPLTLGELWAVPIMLRLGLIENLRRVAVRLTAALADRDAATEWAGQMLRVVEQNPSDLVLVLADMARADPPFTSAFVAELMRHLHGQSPHFAFAQSWLEHRLSEQGLTIVQLVQRESQAQAADQISIGNSITSLRLLSSTDWRDFVEAQSLVEQTLDGDPAGVYPAMSFSTRNSYRSVIEAIANHSKWTELEVAQHVVQASAAVAATDPGSTHAHVGYHLVGRGREALERATGFRAPATLFLRRILRRYPLTHYLSSVLLLTAGMLAMLIAVVEPGQITPWTWAWFMGPLLLCVMQLGISLVNWLAMLFVHPRPLPRMDFSHGIPAAHKTMVVVPTMLGDAQTVQDLLERIEIHYAANRDPHLHFALLTDFKDAPQEDMPSDAEQVRQIRAGIIDLNARYGAERGDLFYLFHRARRWNACDRVWMGFERKRGKLEEFNALLRGAGQERFSEVVGDLSVLPQVRYVITLDTDTLLPRDAARDMAGAMAHPLNRPVLNAAGTCVIDGHGILQPRVAINLPTATRSRYVRLSAAEVGLDPYTRVVSDVYQDLFDEGSFIGKGIYDVDAFIATCGDFPDNTILSHDLLEGVHARSALLTDVELYEDHPASVAVDASRRHRWIRGDWQIALWLLPWVPARGGARLPNPISALSWWKIFDNLRRSLVPPAAALLCLIAWLWVPMPLAAAFMLLVVALFTLIPLIASVSELIRKPFGLPWSMHLRASGPASMRRFGQALLALAFLPYEAYLNLDAILRTIARMGWTHRSMLEWTTSNDAERRTPSDLLSFMRAMAIAPAIAMVAMALVAWWDPTLLSYSTPLLALWFVSPWAAWYLSLGILPTEPRLSSVQKQYLRSLARKTWRYFETFVNEEENWLPPDNFQEHPARVVASRTSPTNIGVALLANLAAYDFGYASVARMLRRSQNTLQAMARLEQYQGHFYNWYDTRTLLPLQPHYVSTVDSGNLAMHLMVLQRGLLEIADTKIVSPRIFEGLQDTLRAYGDAARGPATATPPRQQSRALEDALRNANAMIVVLNREPDDLGSLVLFLDGMVIAAAEFAAMPHDGEEARWWAQACLKNVLDQRDDLRHLAPWAFLTPPAGLFPVTGTPAQISALGAFHEVLARLNSVPTLRQAAALEQVLLPAIEAVERLGMGGEWLVDLRVACVEGAHNAVIRIQELEATANVCAGFAAMNFAFLYDESRDLMSIGYSVSDNRLDNGYYDLLASEARAASYLAIAQGQVGQEHWFALRRMLTTSTGLPALLSWNGSMFEYLMPLLVMPTFENTLLDQTYKAVVQRQIDYGKQQDIPWGISESGYNLQDLHHNYQYRGFGVPGLGLKRGLIEDRVVAPYATMLALMVAPEAACKNLQRLSAEGREGAYGLYEAIDYTATRLPRGAESAIIRSFMVHHQGMGLLALAYLLLDRPMQRRFSASPALRATELLLQERVPRLTPPIFPHAIEVNSARTPLTGAEESMRVITDPSAAAPEVHLLSNGRLNVMVSSGGGGYSRWRELDVTRWREDPTSDACGSFCYFRDLETGRFWSAGHQPTLKPSQHYEAVFVQAKAEFRRHDEQIELHTEISVSPEDDIELRRTTITNRSNRARSIEVTSYAEIVLAPAGQDMTHPAFSNLFVETELLRNWDAILCTRRPRSAEERPPWLTHLMTIQGEALGNVSFETNRQNFIGRCRSLAQPAAMDAMERLSDTQGCVLDPVVAIRRVIRLQPNETARVDIVTGIAETRDAAMGLTEKYHDPRLSDRVFELAWTHSQVELRHINATEADAQLYLRLAGAVIYANALHRADKEILLRNRRAQSGLWGHGISGDLPIVLIRIRDREKLDLVRQAFQAHAYWRLKGLMVDLVIWNEDESVYRQDLFDTIVNLIAASPEAGFVDKPGGVYLRRGEQIPEEDRILLQASARIILADDAGTMREQVDFRRRIVPVIPLLKTSRQQQQSMRALDAPKYDLAYFNGIGGFTHDGREYISILQPGQNTPAPWSNVIANPHFGTVVSESGSVYTWANNAHEFRITPWSNDPVSDASGEAIYLRDEESGRVWSPSPRPTRAASPYVIRHGFGYSVFECEVDGLASVLSLYVDMDAPVKYARLKLTNRSGRPRRLSATAFWEIVLGELRSKALMHAVTELDSVTGAIFARNPFNTEYGGRIAFFDTSEIQHTITGDRNEFLGRNGTLGHPAAMRRARLSGRVGAGFDPCAAIQASLQIEDGDEREIIFTMGAADSEDEARAIVQRTRGAGRAQEALEDVWNFWGRTLGTVNVETPDAALNFLVNGWLPYQTLACRLWARTGFYQSGGAYGFRDQLQDCMALVHAQPHLVREHLLRAAARQFVEGDVQHWWHADSGRGVRTHFSDDYLWLPYTVCRYVRTTGDTSVLDERIPFLEGRAVRPDEEGYYDLPQISTEHASLYEHCVRAITNGLRFGEHGLPLMGCGDWNDGMNLVGEHGKGESVWLGFFLYDVLTQFVALARQREDHILAGKCTIDAYELGLRIEASAWDGQWYRRAYFDDGQPLGSTENQECQIDSIAQSWSVLSGAGDPTRAAQAMDSVDQRLVRRDARLIQLFDPPFDKSELNPGYIKGYSPGVRENGGQYTHAAIWVGMAFAALHDSKRAWEIFSLLNPVTHGTTPEALHRYRVEPYVIAADVYGATPHTGRGGWTWYTGSSSWMYRFITESLLGLHLESDTLRFTPCMPQAWESFKLHYRHHDTTYHITIRKEHGDSKVTRVILDQAEQPDGLVHLIDDQQHHDVEIVLGAASAPSPTV